MGSIKLLEWKVIVGVIRGIFMLEIRKLSVDKEKRYKLQCTLVKMQSHNTDSSLCRETHCTESDLGDRILLRQEGECTLHKQPCLTGPLTRVTPAMLQERDPLRLAVPAHIWFPFKTVSGLENSTVQLQETWDMSPEIALNLDVLVFWCLKRWKKHPWAELGEIWVTWRLFYYYY